MTDDEQQQDKERARNRAIIDAAWHRLVKNQDFLEVFGNDLQRRFPPFACSFQSSDGFNPHSAALREGARQVISYIFTQIHKPEPDEDEQPKPTQASV